jgi:hypothetical protein
MVSVFPLAAYARTALLGCVVQFQVNEGWVARAFPN